MRLPNERETMRHATFRFLSAVLFSSTLLGPRALAQDRAAAPRESTPSGAAALIGEVLSPRNRMEEALRVLTPEMGGRVTGSPGYEAALQWGMEALRRAGVDSVRLEPYDAPARWESESAAPAVVPPYECPLRVFSFALAPSPPGVLTAPLVDAGPGRRSDFEKLGNRAK